MLTALLVGRDIRGALTSPGGACSVEPGGGRRPAGHPVAAAGDRTVATGHSRGKGR